MKRAVLVLVVIAALNAASAYASNIMLMHVGQADGSGTPAVACGTGVIDLSAGCTLPIALGLVP